MVENELTLLARVLNDVRRELEHWREWLRSHDRPATKSDLAELEKRIMSAISDFAAKQNAFQDRVDAAILGLQGDIKSLNDKITELQNSPGTITPEDQALLDTIQGRAEKIALKLEALDALTPPTPPQG